jgi:hypothetical protein
MNTRQTIVNSLAVVGFVVLLAGGVWLAIYSARLIPLVAMNGINRVGGAAVYLSSFFNQAPEPSLVVVETPTTASTTISFGDTGTDANSASSVPKPSTPTPGPKTSGTYPTGGTNTSLTLSGLSDLVVIINKVGYLATTSAESFVASTTVPSGSRPAVNFTIKNIGTNTTGPWRFSAVIPTQSSYLYQSQPQQSLNPGDSIDYTLGFDEASRGTEKVITIMVNFDHTVAESNTQNDTASTTLTILGS